MKTKSQYSILYPDFDGVEYKRLSESACHDLSLDLLCKNLAKTPSEYALIMDIISNMTKSTQVARYRQKIFADILRLPDLRKRITELFDKFEFIRNFGVHHLNSDEKMGIWHLLRRMDELRDYIGCVEAMQECFSQNQVESEGLKGFGKYIEQLYREANFGEMKKDIDALRVQSSLVRSVTVGINVNDRFEATGLGLISVNSKPFKKSGIVSNFADAISTGNKIHDTTEWNGDMHYHPVDAPADAEGFLGNIMNVKAKVGLMEMKGLASVANKAETVAPIADGDGMANTTFYLSNAANKMLDMLIKKLRTVLNKYADIAVVNIAHVIPEFIYYIRFAEFAENMIAQGYNLCEAEVICDGDVYMCADGFYNMRLAISGLKMEEIVTNDLCFDKERAVYILTGANRGGKTTVTQAVGIMYALAQGGMFVPASSFRYKPTDCIYTHFPADEDKTLDLGRLGEECIRFKQDYNACTKDSLYLLNESFSTTSFEEGYYIASDSVRALLKKSVRTIYNTHMHKLGEDIGKFNELSDHAKASSLVVKTSGDERSFKLEIAPPDGMSHARDIALKYGVTYEMLTTDTN